jgi:hypothetical protein
LKKNLFGPSQFFTGEFELALKKHKKNKKVCSGQKWGFERKGEGSSGIQSQEGQDLTAAVAALSLTQESS